MHALLFAIKTSQQGESYNNALLILCVALPSLRPQNTLNKVHASHARTLKMPPAAASGTRAAVRALTAATYEQLIAHSC